MTAIEVGSLCQTLDAPCDQRFVGGKAHVLGRMQRAGIAVPQGFVLSAEALDAHLAENASEAVAGGDPSEIRDRIRSGVMPGVVREQLLLHAAVLLAHGPVVVRSSAIGEDGEADSFAGQLDSVLHVSNADSLERAVLDVWASLWSERAVFYRSARRLAVRGMGVVVQRQVRARAAGVLFTATTGGEMLVEYVRGLGDTLVSGAADPARVAIDRSNGEARGLARNEFVLESHHLSALRTIGLALEAAFERPQDVEWALDDDGTLFVVQSRPITAPVTIPHERPTGPRQAWSNANVNENFPRPISPLLYSIASAGYTHYFRNLAVALGVSRHRIQAMEPAFQRIIGVHGARMYYNLTSIHSVLRLAPFGRMLTASFDTFVGADGASVETATPRAGRLEQLAEVAVIAFNAARLFRGLDRRIARFERVVDAFAARTEPSKVAAMPLAELRAAIAGFMEIRCHKWLDASLADAASMICYGALERLLRGAFPGGAVHTSLLKAIPDVVSGEPVLHLWDLSRLVRENVALREVFGTASPAETLSVVRGDARFAEFREAFQAYLDDWGFRCSEELMLTSPSFQENPTPLVEMVRAYARIDGDSPRDTIRAQAAERERETRRVVSELRPVRAAMLEALLSRTHSAIRYRERARLKQALLYSRCRRIALAIGGALARLGTIAERDDVFFLTWQELDALTGGRAMLPHAVRDVIASRKREHARLSATNPPDSFTLAEGECLEEERVPADDPPREIGGRLTGIPACGGRVTGRAAVLRDVAESARLERGDVLVTKQTDPGWGPVFFLISGLVIERGGMLSHGAIIAREFGIPCVVGVKNAMERIPPGATIAVDGDTGTVHVDV